MRTDTPQVGYAPYRQVHAHSTANPNSTAQNEADYMQRKDLNSGFYTHVVGNGRIIQTAPTNRGAYDVGGDWNAETYAAVELIESHKTKDEFMRDYKIYVGLLRDLAKQAGIPTTLDSGALAGIKTHDYCTHHQPNNGSDHVDPYPYLAKWGISREQFKKDVESGSVSAKPTQPTQSKPASGGGYKVEPYNVRQVTDTVLNVRAAQNTSSRIIRTLPAGYQFNATRICRNGENVNGYTTWAEVDGQGWVSMAYTTPVKATPAAPQRVAASGSYRVKYTTNIRNAPSTSASVVGTYAPGESFNYDSYIDTNGYRWYSYVSYSGHRRYVAAID
ncbi:SH3 domain-containing protein [Enterococcus cecorum]|uniref:SH3 domain-containing protein n=1 Tax=Enterococcus cecorum TaxID=44008 RepID=UPI00148E4099|nr:SH3 domain-containing protein [Enterococcus cecorum]